MSFLKANITFNYNYLIHLFEKGNIIILGFITLNENESFVRVCESLFARPKE